MRSNYEIYHTSESTYPDVEPGYLVNEKTTGLDLGDGEIFPTKEAAQQRIDELEQDNLNKLPVFETIGGTMKEATFVIIADVKYRVAGVTQSGSRGKEYQLADAKGRIVRLCHAPPDGYRPDAVFTSGSRIEYIYTEEEPNE